MRVSTLAFLLALATAVAVGAAFYNPAQQAVVAHSTAPGR